MSPQADLSRLTPANLLAALASIDPCPDADLASRWVRHTLLAGPVATTPSITTRLPFPYHWIPGRLRIALRDRMVTRAVAHLAGAARFPGLYADHGLDVVTSRVDSADGPRWRWPDDRRCAMVLTQDVDTCLSIRRSGRCATWRNR